MPISAGQYDSPGNGTPVAEVLGHPFPPLFLSPTSTSGKWQPEPAIGNFHHPPIPAVPDDESSAARLGFGNHQHSLTTRHRF